MIRVAEIDEVIGNILSAVSLRSFWPRERIIDLVRRIAEQPNNAREARLSDGGYRVDASQQRALLIFTSSRQQVWLVADQLRVYVVLDDRQWEDPQVNASVPLNIARPVDVRTGDSDATGRLRLGASSGELQVSMVLFQRVDARKIIEDFLNEQGC